jgi:hypothetical protein
MIQRAGSGQVNTPVASPALRSQTRSASIPLGQPGLPFRSFTCVAIERSSLSVRQILSPRFRTRALPRVCRVPSARVRTAQKLVSSLFSEEHYRWVWTLYKNSPRPLVPISFYLPVVPIVPSARDPAAPVSPSSSCCSAGGVPTSGLRTHA